MVAIPVIESTKLLLLKIRLLTRPRITSRCLLRLPLRLPRAFSII